MPDTRPAGLLLAAGGSERLGEAKQLVRLGGESLVRRAAGLLLDLATPAIAVTGAASATVARELRGLSIQVAHNQDWQSGMGGSIAAGMAAVGDECVGVLVLLCDQWRIESADLQALIRAWRIDPSQVVAARWDGQFGAPAVFPRAQFAELRRLSGKKGAKSLIDRRGARFIDMPNAAHDLDTPEDLQALRQWRQVLDR